MWRPDSRAIPPDKCGDRFANTKMVHLDEVRKAILTALSTMEDPAGGGGVAKRVGLATPKVVPRMWGLLKRGLVERPLQGKYVISDLGRGVA